MIDIISVDQQLRQVGDNIFVVVRAIIVSGIFATCGAFTNHSNTVHALSILLACIASLHRMALKAVHTISNATGVTVPVAASRFFVTNIDATVPCKSQRDIPRHDDDRCNVFKTK
jgi:hypothetical protein